MLSIMILAIGDLSLRQLENFISQWSIWKTENDERLSFRFDWSNASLDEYGQQDVKNALLQMDC